MSVMIQIRNVPTALHRKLKARAAMAGMSLSEYLLRLAERDAEKPTLQEWLALVRQAPAAPPGLSPTDALRAERDGR